MQVPGDRPKGAPSRVGTGPSRTGGRRRRGLSRFVSSHRREGGGGERREMSVFGLISAPAPLCLVRFRHLSPGAGDRLNQQIQTVISAGSDHRFPKSPPPLVAVPLADPCQRSTLTCVPPSLPVLTSKGSGLLPNQGDQRKSFRRVTTYYLIPSS